MKTRQHYEQLAKCESILDMISMCNSRIEAARENYEFAKRFGLLVMEAQQRYNNLLKVKERLSIYYFKNTLLLLPVEVVGKLKQAI